MKEKLLKESLLTCLSGILNSYAQIFFSNNKLFASILLIVTFFDFGAGASGLISIVVAQVAASLFNFNKQFIRDGSYTYNSLLVGLAIGIFYQFNLSLFLLLIIASLLTLFVTLWMLDTLAKKALPFLSIPFLIITWIIILGAGNFSSLDLRPKHVISLAEYFPGLFEYTAEMVATWHFADIFILFFRSLGAIFFQYNEPAGILIAIGLLIYSRIALVLAFFGFLVGFWFYRFFEGDFTELVYSYIGFNFVLTAIALGGFFVVPSRRSFLLLLFVIPMIAFLISALHIFFSYFSLPLYTLPFNIVVLLVLSALAMRTKATGLHLVSVQQFSPEKNHYKFFNHAERFSAHTNFHIALPYMGEWYVSQGHSGNITHKGDWQYAWDFDVRDDYAKTFRVPGTDVKDYYCYDLPVLAPATGWVVKIVDGIPDNPVGNVNLDKNWGNTIVIKHTEFLYSELSHLRKDTLQTKEGDYVSKGQIVGYCGSSGRSPEPHLHFQLQATPYIGSKTMNYPISYYICKENGLFNLHCFDYPKEGDTVLNVATSKLLTNAFAFIPGKTLEWEINNGKSIVKNKWEVFTDSLNNTYIYCYATKSSAYFVNNGTMFYFTDYYGDTSALLYHFYSGAHKVLLGYYEGVRLNEPMLLTGHFNRLLLAIHDITAPLFHYCSAKYLFEFTSIDSYHHPEEIRFKGICNTSIWGKAVNKTNYEFIVNAAGFNSFNVDGIDISLKAKCIG